MRFAWNKRFLITGVVIGLVLFTARAAVAVGVPATRTEVGQAPTEELHIPELDNGFHLLYELEFEEARSQLEAWQKSHPQDPLGYASEAASYLFEECYRLGVLTSEFFLDNKRFLGNIPLKPDPHLQAAFVASVKQTQDLAQLQLKTNPDDPNALFAMSLGLGMQADYASLIDKRQFDSLRKIREADTYSNRLLKIAPDAADAYLGLGTANYVIGSLPGTKKLFLGLAGIHGDKKRGMEQLETAANHGHYLRPFAKILLALTALREKRPEVARAQFTQLAAEFPANPLLLVSWPNLMALPREYRSDSSGPWRLGLSAFVTRLHHAGMPLLVLRVGIAEPFPAFRTPHCCRIIAALIGGRHALA